MSSHADNRVFVETTAIVQNALGRQEVREGIHQVTEAAKLYTSEFVLFEFSSVVSGLYDRLRERLLANIEPDRSNTVDEVLRDALDGTSPILPGGYPQVVDLCARIARSFGNRAVTAREMANWLLGEKVSVEASGLRFNGQDLRKVGVLIDNHSCCVFDGRPPCLDTPGDDCRFEWACGSRRNAFLSNIEALAAAGREESDWLSRNLNVLQQSFGRGFLLRVRQHIGHFGDLIIFFAVPENATLLTRDATFGLLNEKTGRSIRIFRVRAIRRSANATGTAIIVGGDSLGARVPITLLNWTSRDCRLRLLSPIAKKGDRIHIKVSAPSIDSIGTIMSVSSNDDYVEYGVRFKAHRKR